MTDGEVTEAEMGLVGSIAEGDALRPPGQVPLAERLRRAEERRGLSS